MFWEQRSAVFIGAAAVGFSRHQGRDYLMLLLGDIKEELVLRDDEMVSRSAERDP